MVDGHVVLELLGVRLRGRLPARHLLGGVEVVGQVLGLAVAHFPVWREAGLGLLEGACLRQRTGEVEGSSKEARGGITHVGHGCGVWTTIAGQDRQSSRLSTIDSRLAVLHHTCLVCNRRT